MSDNYEYDVAFSFLKEDEELAFKINDVIRDRVKTFIYSEQQEKIAGTDGEETFNRVFETEARIVVVLYRENWGKTSWTRIEETAIRNRAFEEGYDFVTFIPLNTPPTAPKYLPKPRVWIGLDRWGIDGAASVIEARVQQSGGAPHEETAVEKAKRIEREIAAEEGRGSFLESELGVQTANEQINILFSELEKTLQAISSENKKFKFKKERKDELFTISIDGLNLKMSWFNKYRNTLRDSRLYVQLHFGYRNDSSLLKDVQYDFDRKANIIPGWQEIGRGMRFYTSSQLAQECIKMLLDKVREWRLSGQDLRGDLLKTLIGSNKV
jgi:hypothetical protein